MKNSKMRLNNIEKEVFFKLNKFKVTAKYRKATLQPAKKGM